MPKRWQDEVRDIVERERFDPSGQRRQANEPGVRRGLRLNPIDRLNDLGEWVRRRFGTTGDMLVTAAGLVVIALLLAIFLRQFASVLAIAGALIFAAALARGIVERRSGRGGGSRRSGPAMWRGQVIDLRERRQSSLRDRFSRWWRGRR